MGCPYIFVEQLCCTVGVPREKAMAEPSEIIFEVTEAVEGDYDARAALRHLHARGRLG